jgi:O-antigen/teichoic acid export membrane protein
MGSSHAFFSFASKRERSKSFFVYYAAWLVVQFVLSALFIAVLAPDNWILKIWAGECRTRVFIAFVAVFLQQQIWTMIAQIGESQRLTARVQIINIAIAVLHLLLVGWVFWMKQITVELIYYFIMAEYLLAGIASYMLFPLSYSDEHEKLKNILVEYRDYCLPLIPYAFISMTMGFADSWLLQNYGGAVEQAYYSIAAKFSAISLIATASIIRILWKEVAEANERGNRQRVQHVYERANRILFMLGLIISGFLIPWTKEIILLMLGNKYVGGSFVMALMFLYPIYQTLGQINGTMFYALELTRPCVLIGMIRMVVATIAAYFMLAPASAFIPGLGLASTGLALKMVVLQFFGVNFSIWWLSRHQGWQFHCAYQLIGLAIFLPLGFIVYWGVNLIMSSTGYVVIRGGVAGGLYVLISALIIYSMPWFIGMERDNINQMMKQLLQSGKKLFGI